VFAQPALDASVLAELPQGMHVKVRARAQGWVGYVMITGRLGWVPEHALRVL